MNSVSRRTRSRVEENFREIHQEIKRKRGEEIVGIGSRKRNVKNDRSSNRDAKLKSTAINLTSDDSEKSSDEEEDSEDSGEEYKLNSGKNVRKSVKKGGQKAGRPPKKKNCLKSEVKLIDGLVESIWKEKDSLHEEEPVRVKKNAPNLSTLPLKFRFEDEKKLPEKTEKEKEIDSLFRQLEFALGESEIGCSNFSVTDDEDTSSIENDESSTVHCTQGRHDHFLDEQIGITCKICSAVLLEIKHVLPHFYVEPPQRCERKDSEASENSTTNQFQFQCSASDNLESSIHSEGTVLDLIPDTEKELYPHQREGFEFMWKSIAGDIQMKNLARLSAKQGGGCLISHAPGTGKTRLTIVFLQTFMKVYPACRPMIIAPKTLLSTWKQEFLKWKVDIKFHNLNENTLSSEEIVVAPSVVDQTQVNIKDKDCVRFLKLLLWTKGEGILGISYNLFEKLAGDHKKKASNEKFRKMLLELPGLVVLDEGHTPRNSQSLLLKSLKKVTTKRRVILSGTPFQNNFIELHNTLCLVNPSFDKKVDKCQWDHLASSISKNNPDDQGLNKIRSIIEPFVHIHQDGFLQKTLQGLRECLIILKPTDLQTKLLQSITQPEKSLDYAHLASLISVHPSIISNPSILAKNPNFSVHKKNLQNLESNPNAGVKTRFLIELINLSYRLGEKVLIFSQFIDPLLQIKRLIKHKFSWIEGKEIIYMDGEIGIKQRQCSINCFNDKSSSAKVMLASQRACSEGINLVGASRVVLIDVVWNPSVAKQAISRAYRIGQDKIVYVYHLVTELELKKYVRQAEKERIAERIFSKGGGEEETMWGGLLNDVVLKDEVLEAMIGHESLKGVFEKIIHNPKESDLHAFGVLDPNLKHDF